LIQSQQSDDVKTSSYSLLGGESKEGEDALTTFQRIILKLLKINLKTKHIYPVYDYFHDTLDKVNYVFYAEVKSPKTFNSFKKNTLSWVTFNETLKLLFSPHTKQDVIVGERVINLKMRLALNLQNPLQSG